MIRDEMIVLVVIESVFSIVSYKKVLPISDVGPWNESYDCTVCGARPVGAVGCSDYPFSTTLLAVRERIWNESRTDIPSMLEKVNLAALWS